MIRRATHDDVPAIVAMGELFHVEAGWADIADYVADDCAATVRALIDNPEAVVLVAEDDGQIVGMTAGITFPLYFNAGHRSGQEMWLYVQPGRRDGLGGKLLTALEREAKAIGANSFAMIALDKANPKQTGMFYQRRGYRASEHTWIKRL